VPFRFTDSERNARAAGVFIQLAEAMASLKWNGTKRRRRAKSRVFSVASQILERGKGAMKVLKGFVGSGIAKRVDEQVRIEHVLAGAARHNLLSGG
jgi:hypothetical protein